LLRPSFIPPPPLRELREFVRTHQDFTQERTRQGQRIQKVLQGCNIKLDSVLSDISGASGLAINCAPLSASGTPQSIDGVSFPYGDIGCDAS
jgi:transposase